MDQNALRNACLKRDNNYKMLHEKVYVDMEYDRTMQDKLRSKILAFKVPIFLSKSFLS